ncbi:MAG TPA: cellulase family glycosylhydrolase [Chitinophagaceae bacterium]|nr:cellulase family glycosylhydrolase [Chitinophagaceae bacterium]
MNTVDFTCAIDKDEQKPLHHYWEHTVGSGHATMALRADWQQQLTKCRHDLGFRYVRFHGILCDDMGTLVDEKDKLVYSFHNIDVIIDFLLSIGMRPFIELSFMPTTLASGDKTTFHYNANVTPPKDYDAWEKLINKLVTHLVNRYGKNEVGQWFFEVWNEPNLNSFWTGTQADYFKLYMHTAKVVKNICPSAKIGGPATAKNEWITEMVEFAKKEELSLDFISTHHYPTDAFGSPGDNTIEQLAKSRRSVLRDEASETKKKAGNIPVYYTEWSASSNPFDELHDEPYSAAFIVKTVLEANGYVEGYSYWTFSDLFEENYFSSVPFHGGFGLQTIHGIPKPSYRAYQLLHKLGNNQVAVAGSHQTVDAWATCSKQKIQMLLSNSALPKHPIQTAILKISVTGAGNIKGGYIERIDDDHANPLKTWKAMGSPADLLPLQVHAAEAASMLIKEPLTPLVEDGTVFLNISIPPQGVACITLEL